MWGKMFQTTNQYWMAEPHIVPSTCEGSAAPQRRHRLLRLPWKRSLRQEGWIIEGKIHREASFDRKHIGFSEAYFPLKEFWDFIYFQDVQHIYIYIPNGYKALNPSNPIFPQHELHSQCCGIDKFCICLKGSNKSTVGKDAPLIIRFPSLDGLTTDV